MSWSSNDPLCIYMIDAANVAMLKVKAGVCPLSWSSRRRRAQGNDLRSSSMVGLGSDATDETDGRHHSAGLSATI